jgi:hypothetical protein
MINEKYTPKEALERAKLLMSYDTKKTLTENKDSLNEQAWLIPAAIPVVTGWLNDVLFAGETPAKVKTFFKGCSTLSGLKPTEGINFNSLATEMWDAGGNFGGYLTNEDKIKEIFLKFKTPADLCEFSRIFSGKYRDLFYFLNNQLSGSDWRTYVWGPMYDIIEKTPIPSPVTPEPSPVTPVTPGPSPVTPGPKKSKYTSCPETFPIKQTCKNNKIKEIQACLNMPTKYQTGNFGPITQGYLEKAGVSGTEITQDSYDKVCNKTTTTDWTDAETEDITSANTSGSAGGTTTGGGATSSSDDMS